MKPKNYEISMGFVNYEGEEQQYVNVYGSATGVYTLKLAKLEGTDSVSLDLTREQLQEINSMIRQVLFKMEETNE